MEDTRPRLKGSLVTPPPSRPAPASRSTWQQFTQNKYNENCAECTNSFIDDQRDRSLFSIRIYFFVDVAQHISRCPDVHLSDDDGGLAGAHHGGEVVSDGRSLLGLDTALEMEIQTLVLGEHDKEIMTIKLSICLSNLQCRFGMYDDGSMNLISRKESFGWSLNVHFQCC